MKEYRVRERQHEELLDDLLAARGITAKEEFLSPDFVRDSHDPFLLPDMDAAVRRLLNAFERDEKVAVWSDYDCDGIPGGVMLAEFLRAWGLAVVHYIPHRHKEGYGLNEEGIDELVAQNAKLIVTVDLGTSDAAAVAYARARGIDVIVTDHHLVPEHTARPLALVNPKRADSRYPFDGLCGAGVAWKLVQALLLHRRPPQYEEGREKWLLDLVGIATLSDMVPLTGENRMLAYFGLKVMRAPRWSAQRPGLSALLELLRINARFITEDDVSFMVSPRINAASRMDVPQTAANLLAAKGKEEALGLAHTLNRINDERKGIVAATVKEAHKRLAGQDLTASPLIVMGNPNWRPGVLGLVAGKLVETHGKPVFLWGREGGEVIRGSVRSDGGLNVVELMSAVGDVFDDFGGHYTSGGFSIDEERIHELAPRLMAAYETISLKSTSREVVIDRVLDLAEVPHAKRSLARLSPFGMGNEKPLFVFPGLRAAALRTFGKAQDHLEVTFSSETAPEGVSAVAFFSTPQSFGKPLERGMRADVAGHIESDWRGNARIRLVDIL